MPPAWRDTMAQAQQLALQGMTLTSPNPRVGCVITDAQGGLLGQGHTQRAGGPHAEIMALRDAQARGVSVQGGSAYVTLEPCSHHGRTPPCCDALINAGIKQVVVASIDPNPRVAGQGVARLRAAGVPVTVLPGDDPLARQTRALNIGFFSRMLRQRPWVRMKIAASLDGKTALPDGQSQWITSTEARADGHAWRARACAILTGIGTVLTDRPRLDVRLAPTQRQPGLVVLDSALRTPLDAPFLGAGRAVQIWATGPNDAKMLALQARGAQVHCQAGAGARVDLFKLLGALASQEINELHVEAGATLNGALLQAGLVDELLLYLAPKLLGAGLDMSAWGPLRTLEQAPLLRFESVQQLGPDLRILARFIGHDDF